MGKSYTSDFLSGNSEEIWIRLSSYEDIYDSHECNVAVGIMTDIMHRVKSNIELLIHRLLSLGYLFDDTSEHAHKRIEEYKEIERMRYRNPPLNIGVLIEKLEKREGKIPLSLRLFYKIVGSVNLTGHFPDNRFGTCYLDALQVNPIELVLDMQTFFRETEDYDVPFVIPIAPDQYYKVGESGGSTYSIELPNASLDALLQFEPHATYFIDYLRLCFQWGGFLGLENYGQMSNDILELRKDLMLF